MKLTSSLLLPAFASLALASSRQGHLFIYDADTVQTTTSRTISPETARLILASRLGLDDTLGSADEEVLGAINDYAGQQPLFGADTRRSSVALLLAQGQDALDTLKSFETSWQSHASISPVPSTKSTEDLVEILAMQAGLDISASNTGVELRGGAAFPLQNGFVQFITPTMNMHDTLQNLAEIGGYTIVALSMPNTTTSKATYRLSASTHQKRQNKEALLASVPSSSSSSPSLSASASSSPSNSTGPLAGIFPHCFSTLSACQTTTRNCTGHGSCKLAFTDKDASSAGAPCYACACTPEVRTNKDGGKKTTVWGGPACQKKDVVAPFWLIGGFTVFLVSLVSWGIGMLLSMGNEELPSVIGAGVSGVPRRS